MVAVAVSDPNSGTVVLTPHACRGSIDTKCTARVSPGSAPSTKNGPVCGLMKRGSQTWLTRSDVERTRPAKQSSVEVLTTVPGRIDTTGSTPPKV